jgi:AhpD family alkylhydroperoxidase
MHVSLVAPADMSPAVRDVWERASPQGKRFVGAVAHTGDHAERFFPYYNGLRFGTSLGLRTCELLRLAIAQTTQCPLCLEGRVRGAADLGLTEDVIAAVGDADDDRITGAEHAVIAFALKFGGDHFAITGADFAALYEHFSEREVVEIGMLCAQFLGYGRMAMTFELADPVCRIPASATPATAAERPAHRVRARRAESVELDPSPGTRPAAGRG